MLKRKVKKGLRRVMQPWGVDTTVITDKGCVRSDNQDSVFLDTDKGLFCVADGMGGEACGKEASEIVVKHISLLAKHKDKTRGKWLVEALKEANKEVFHKGQQLGTIVGSTVATFSFNAWNGKIHTCHVGDSRAYLWRDGELHLLTADDSYAREAGFRADDTVPTIIKGKLTHFVGKQENIKPSTKDFFAENGDILFLCSDGLTEHCDGEDMRRILQKNQNFSSEEITRTFVDTALARGGKDNVSVLVAKLQLRPLWNIVWRYRYLVGLSLPFILAILLFWGITSCSETGHRQIASKRIVTAIAAVNQLDSYSGQSFIEKMNELSAAVGACEFPDIIDQSSADIERQWENILSHLEASAHSIIQSRQFSRLQLQTYQAVGILQKKIPQQVREEYAGFIEFCQNPDTVNLVSNWQHLVRLSLTADPTKAKEIRLVLEKIKSPIFSLLKNDPMVGCLNEKDSKVFVRKVKEQMEKEMGTE